MRPFCTWILLALCAVSSVGCDAVERTDGCTFEAGGSTCLTKLSDCNGDNYDAYDVNHGNVAGTCPDVPALDIESVSVVCGDAGTMVHLDMEDVVGVAPNGTAYVLDIGDSVSGSVWVKATFNGGQFTYTDLDEVVWGDQPLNDPYDNRVSFYVSHDRTAHFQSLTTGGRSMLFGTSYEIYEGIYANDRVSGNYPCAK